MNVLDIIFIIPLAWFAYKGFQKGFQGSRGGLGGSESAATLALCPRDRALAARGRAGFSAAVRVAEDRLVLALRARFA